MRGSKWANFAEFNFTDEQFSDKNFAILTLKNRISRNLISQIGPKFVKISSLKVNCLISF